MCAEKCGHESCKRSIIVPALQLKLESLKKKLFALKTN